MRAGVFRGIRDIQVEDVADPEPGADGIVVEVSACGICGSDLHTYLHGSFVAPGQVMGHEFAGSVVAVGDQVDGVAVGDRVTASPLVACGECARCREGKSNVCVHLWEQAIAYGNPGAFAERVRVPASQLGKNVFKLSDSVSDDAAATAEPLAVGVHAVRLADPVQGATALVIGLGTIGQQVAQALWAHGAARVIGVDITELRLDAARGLGVEAVDGGSDTPAAIAGVLGAGDEIDMVFECSGVSALAQAGLELVKAGGTMVMVALYDDPVTFDGTMVVQKEVVIRGSIGYTGDDFQAAVDLLESGRAKADALITHRERLEDLPGAFETQLAKDRALKVLVNP